VRRKYDLIFLSGLLDGEKKRQETITARDA
jgi:hypothetical protein